MKVVVTGASGYIGRHVVDALIKMHHEVIAVDMINKGINTDATFLSLDIFSDDIYNKLGRPDACIHMAWKDGFNHASDAHMGMLSKHYAFIKNMIDGGVKYLSVMGTMHEIGYYEGCVDENTPTNPLSMYGIAKNALREASLLLAEKSNTSLMWLRAYYILGDDSNNNSIFTKITQMEHEGKASFPFVSGKNKYDFIHVDELAKQIATASTQSEITGIINCCSGKPVSLADKVNEFIEKNHFSIRPDYGKFPERPYDSPAIWGDNTKINLIMEKHNDTK
ncbi:NAD(P)-dependent oxidoreductase [uncultured Holdemanella sp.]|uniref:NAD-dependent epimerase/dehydratase family protein n=1 Tax=uncultured Holdemanella sp. TaxID=1763549 RepID=UPI0025887CD1|nr:NAD(P)-dependent oxidoreductase [uncultured Holdemanella sp.]